MTRARRPRVALVAHGIHDDGGMERAFAELIRRAHDHFDFEVFAAELAPDLRDLVTWRRIRVPLRPIPLKFVAFFLRAAMPIARVDVDLVHVLGAIVPNRADVVSVQYCHAAARQQFESESAQLGGFAKRLNTRIARAVSIAAERFCYRPGRSGTMACVSPGVEAEIRKHYPGLTAARTPNGVDLHRFRPDEQVRARVRQEEGVDRAFVCLFVGGDWGRKGLAVVTSALARAGCRMDLRLWVVGEGERRRFERLAEENGLDGRVRFFGHRRDTECFFQAADVFVLPTAYEAAPLVLYEAAASCLPIVTTRVNGVQDLVVDGESGLLVERDADSLANALVALAKDPGRRALMGRAARRYASPFTWDRSADSVVGIYQRLLESSEEALAA